MENWRTYSQLNWIKLELTGAHVAEGSGQTRCFSDEVKRSTDEVNWSTDEVNWSTDEVNWSHSFCLSLYNLEDDFQSLHGLLNYAV